MSVGWHSRAVTKMIMADLRRTWSELSTCGCGGPNCCEGIEFPAGIEKKLSREGYDPPTFSV